MSAFDVATDGSLSTVDGSPFPDLQTAPCWVEISRDGQFLFAVNTGSDSISRYAIADFAADGSDRLRNRRDWLQTAGRED